MYIITFIVMIYFIDIKAGFLPGHSTVYQLLKTYHHIVQSIDDGKVCCMVFCDLSKAFDRVWHKGLIFKLQTYGITGDILQWFKSYVCSRSQRVLYKDLLSSKLKCFCWCSSRFCFRTSPFF
jgi:hypothetical protein